LAGIVEGDETFILESFKGRGPVLRATIFSIALRVILNTENLLSNALVDARVG
jgi:hypothetical protein